MGHNVRTTIVDYVVTKIVCYFVRFFFLRLHIGNEQPA
jgi:hypothetical protein